MNTIIEKPEKICNDHYLIKIYSPGIFSQPGQFVNIRIGEQTDPLLRRPFSIHNHANDVIEVVFKVVGKGTRLLRDYLKPGEIDFIGPRGTGFTLIEGGKALLIGGGVGNAPLYYLARILKERNNHISYLYGARSNDFIYLKDRYNLIADSFILVTDDGSEGRKALVTDIASDILSREDFDYIYLCGPSDMLRRALSIVHDKAVPVEASIEKYFGCGIGLCYGCAVETTDGFKRACIDGPIFNGRIIHSSSL